MTVDYELLKKVKDALAELGPSLEKRNDEPSTAALKAAVGPTDDSSESPRSFLEPSEQWELREMLHKKSTAELHAMLSVQARKNTGVPYQVWAATGGAPTMAAISRDPILTKALDSSGASALIRQDLEPVLTELYIREFPAWDRFAKVPANGLVHAYDRITSYGDAQFMTELGTVTDDTSAYERATTPVSVIATRRGISLRSQFAVQAGGMNFNPEQLELQGGLRSIAHKMQKTIFQGNASVSSGTASDENGAYDANAFDGLRKLLNGASAVDVDPTAGTPEDIRAAVNTAAITAMQAAGRISIAYLNPVVKGQWDLQLDQNVRYMNSWTEIAVGAQVNAVNTVFGPTPLFPVPGDSVGSYTRSGSTVSDIYLLDESSFFVPYLGSAGITTLDIPVGISGQLTHLFIMFGMWGFGCRALQFSNKVRVKQA